MKLIRENKKLFLILGAIVAYITFLAMPKYYSDDYYKEYVSKTNKEVQAFGKDLKGLAQSFSKTKNIPQTYIDTMYDCLGSLIYTQEADALFETTLQICQDDYDAKKNIIYYNESWLRKEFNTWDASYMPLQKIIQKHIKTPKSYEHLKTTSLMNLTDKRPHMFVSIDFRAANINGYMLDRTMEVKVDAKTKEMYDLK